MSGVFRKYRLHKLVGGITRGETKPIRVLAKTSHPLLVVEVRTKSLYGKRHEKCISFGITGPSAQPSEHVVLTEFSVLHAVCVSLCVNELFPGKKRLSFGLARNHVEDEGGKLGIRLLGQGSGFANFSGHHGGRIAEERAVARRLTLLLTQPSAADIPLLFLFLFVHG
jgi:hypothetical protein